MDESIVNAAEILATAIGVAVARQVNPNFPVAPEWAVNRAIEALDGLGGSLTRGQRDALRVGLERAAMDIATVVREDF